MSSEVAIYKSKKKAAMTAVFGLLLAVAGWLFLRYADNAIVGWSFIMLAGLCVIFGIGNWFDRKPYIILTAAGITEMSALREEIDWDAIRRADDFFYFGQYFLRLLVDRNYKPDLIRPTWFYRFDRLYEREGVKAIFIRISFLEVSSAQLSHLINRMLKADYTHRRELLENFSTKQ